jgi:hypothetical protein
MMAEIVPTDLTRIAKNARRAAPAPRDRAKQNPVAPSLAPAL